MSELTTPAAIAQAWQQAANDQNIERLLALSDEEIEIVGPRGVGRGRHLLRDWPARAGLRVQPLRLFARADVVVVEQRAVWNSPATGGETAPVDIASAFVVIGGRVARVARHASLAQALAASGLSEADHVVGANV